MPTGRRAAAGCCDTRTTPESPVTGLFVLVGVVRLLLKREWRFLAMALLPAAYVLA